MSYTVLSSKISALVKAKGHGRVSIGAMVEKFGTHSYGPLLLLPALLTVAPTGAIPGMPIITGFMIFAISLQMLFGRKSPWLPARLKSIDFKRADISSGFTRILPYVRKVEHYFRPRMSVLALPPFLYLTAAICALMGGVIIFVGIVPFAVAAPGLTVLAFSLGVAAGDGILILTGYLLTAATVALVYFIALG